MTTVVSPNPPTELDSGQLELQQRARTFVENVLMPLEVEAEQRGGALPARARSRRSSARRSPPG